MSKREIIIIVLAIVALIGAADLWAKLKSKDDEIVNLGKKYNQAQVTIKDQLDKITVMDENLKGLNGKRPDQKISYSVKYVTVGSGAITNAVSPFTDITSPIWTFNDFRLYADINTVEKWLQYKLTQKFKTNIYVLDENDYRIEVAEINSKTGEIVQTIPVTDFTVEKKRSPSKWHFGTSLEVGGGAVTTLDPKVKPLGYLSLNFISKGASHLDSDIRVASVGIGTAGGIVSPVSYRISNVIPLVSDLFIEPLVGISFKGKLLIGIGVASTL